MDYVLLINQLPKFQLQIAHIFSIKRHNEMYPVLLFGVSKWSLKLILKLFKMIVHVFRFGPYFCQPVIAGLSDEDKPFICTMDSIGAKYVGYTSLLVYFPSKKYCFLDCFGNLFSFFKDLPKGKER